MSARSSCIRVAMQSFWVVRFCATQELQRNAGGGYNPGSLHFMLAFASGALISRSAPFHNCRSPCRTPSPHHIASGLSAAPVSTVSLAETAQLPLCIHGTLDVYAVSDLHCDYPANLSWVQALPSYRQQPVCSKDGDSTSKAVPQLSVEQSLSCCIVAGDTSDDLRILR